MMIQSKIVRTLRRPSTYSVKTVDDLLRRGIFIYCPVLLFFYFIFSNSLLRVPETTKISKTIRGHSTVIGGHYSTELEEIHRKRRNSNLKNIGKTELTTYDEKGSGLENLNFLLAGFAKTGTTSLLHLFDKHEETSVAPSEICHFNSDAEILKLTSEVAHLPVKSLAMKRGIKCPTSIWDSRGLARLVAMVPNLKIVVGVRHPIFWFQSYYNYRVTEMYDNNAVTKPPQPTSLIGSKKWKGVSTDAARFELGLMQLGLVELESKDLLKLGNSGRRVFPSSSRVFLYAIDQLEDTDEMRSSQFRRELQNFLDLKNEIQSIPRSNVNHFVGASKHPETIDICENKYKQLRSLILKNSVESNHWIKSKFAKHQDVTIGGIQHFFEIIDDWKNDPCLKRKRGNRHQVNN